MAQYKPIVIIGGKKNELGSGDTLSMGSLMVPLTQQDVITSVPDGYGIVIPSKFTIGTGNLFLIGTGSVMSIL